MLVNSLNANDVSELLEQGCQGQIAAISRLITALESGSELAPVIRHEAHAIGGHAHVVGITGAPGSGKSTLISALAKELRSHDKTVGIIAVDPSSALSGGALLGDRIRMQEHTLDREIFVRSMSSRGWLGGISSSTVDAVAVLNATGWDVVIVETVGVGQAEIEVAQIAHTTVVVSVPGLGDDIQAIKAGLLEIADIHVVNKADRPGSDETIADIKNMLMLARTFPDGGWDIPIVATAGVSGWGVDALATALQDHFEWLKSSGELDDRARKIVAGRILAMTRDLLMDLIQAPAHEDDFQGLVDGVLARKIDPHSAAVALIERIAVEK